jgi:hypothetical protein
MCCLFVAFGTCPRPGKFCNGKTPQAGAGLSAHSPRPRSSGCGLSAAIPHAGARAITGLCIFLGSWELIAMFCPHTIFVHV